MLSNEYVKNTYNLLCAGGNKIKTGKRNQMMYQYGGTIGPAQYPTYLQLPGKTVHMLPRPVVKSRPHRLGHRIMNNCNWLRELVSDIERFTLNHLEEDKSPTSAIILDHVLLSKQLIPPCLRICDTFFTQMILLGKVGEKEGIIPIHVDEDDHITALLSIGSHKLVGGDTVYVETYPDDRVLLKKRIPFKHGNVQIGYFDGVLHGSLRWNGGERFVINFSLQKKYSVISMNTKILFIDIISMMVIHRVHFVL